MVVLPTLASKKEDMKTIYCFKEEEDMVAAVEGGEDGRITGNCIKEDDTVAAVEEEHVCNRAYGNI